MGPIQKRTLDRMISLFLVLAVLTALVLAVLIVSYLRGGRTVLEQPAQQLTGPEAEAEEPEGDVELLKICQGELERADGSAISLEDMRGKPVLLLFWSSWCSDCKEYFESGLSDAFDTARAAGLEAHLVCREGRRGENWQSAQRCLEKLGMQEETLMDTGCAVYDQISPGAVPAMALLDPDGRLAAVTTHMPDEAEMDALLELANDGAQRQSERFLLQSLMDDSGAVVSSYGVSQDQVAPGSDVLSETQGLMMLYAVRAGNRDLFDRLYDYVCNAMTVGGLAAWKVTDGQRGEVNATLDDLRIVEALMTAEEKWGGYAQDLSFRESALFRSVLRGGIMRDYAELDTGKACDSVTLCYLDVATMDRIAADRTRWTTAAEKARQILEGGVISEQFPLYYPRFNAKTASYEGEQLQMNEAMVTVYHAARAGIDCSAALDWLQARLEEGAIYAAYDTNGDPVDGYTYESTATYALLAQAALICGREQLAQEALGRADSARCFTPPLAGDLGLETDRQHYTFDLVETLLAWQQWNGRSA